MQSQIQYSDRKLASVMLIIAFASFVFYLFHSLAVANFVKELIRLTNEYLL